MIKYHNYICWLSLSALIKLFKWTMYPDPYVQHAFFCFFNGCSASSALCLLQDLRGLIASFALLHVMRVTLLSTCSALLDPFGRPRLTGTGLSLWLSSCACSAPSLLSESESAGVGAFGGVFDSGVWTGEVGTFGGVFGSGVGTGGVSTLGCTRVLGGDGELEWLGLFASAKLLGTSSLWNTKGSLCCSYKNSATCMSSLNFICAGFHRITGNWNFEIL